MFNGFVVGFQISQQKVKLICQRLRIIDNALTRDKLQSLRMIGSKINKDAVSMKSCRYSITVNTKQHLLIFHSHFFTCLQREEKVKFCKLDLSVILISSCAKNVHFDMMLI